MKRRSYIFVTLVCIFSFISMIAQPVLGAFPDTRGHWAQTHIDLLQSRQLISGYPDGLYRPEDFISEAKTPNNC